ncbi:coiled-coil domain-containing protein 149-like [Plakobranchus ocellatus]|uniref:Coiled-coil domain-containing protein 149-like n=1 Tax=Plakobranchus ocellatus TaxID=259542 RepID=A0AAV4AMA8_9GAST|nr:coiled-coil domain-containing protein 149-like [Plakobranchus ocellatus]
MEEEKSMAIATVSKYKSILEKKKTRGMLKLGQSRSGGLVITQKQVQDVIQNKSSMSPSPQALADLQGLCSALLDTINDKNLALSHQRKTNKLLGNRVSELEKKLKTLEVSGLWSVSGQLPHLEKLKAECEDIKTLVPVQLSPSHSGSESRADGSDFDSVSSSLNNSAKTSPAHRPSGQGITNLQLPQLSHFDLEELDLLPTKEEVVKIDDGLTRQEGKQRSISPLDASLGLSDFLREKDSSFLALTDGTNPTANKSHTMDSGFDQSISNGVLSGNISHSQEEEDGRDSIDSEKREAEIMRILRKESEEEVEDAHLHITGTDGTEVDDDDNDDDDGDAYVYDEASEHLQNLLASVTEKLLQRPGQEKNQNCEVNRLIVHKQKPHCGHEINNQQEQTVYLEENIKTLEEQGGILFAGSQDVTDQELLVDVKEHSQNELSVEVERQTNSQKDEESSRLISHVKQTDAGHVDKRAEQLYTDEQSKPSKC